MENFIKNVNLIFSLAKSDFKKRFVGSYFGIVWMFVQPLATVLVYTLVFQVGFKTIPPIANIPYVIWLLPGIIPWFYFQDIMIQGTNVLFEYSFLVKKVVFNVSLLPIVKLVSILFSHIIFVAIMIIVFIITRIHFSFSVFLIIYFSFSLSIFALALIYITSSINIFFKDMSQIVAILMQFGIWMSPIMYDESIFVNKAPIVCKLLTFNPIYYIVKGYRYAMLGDVFNSFVLQTAYFWLVTITLFVVGFSMFNKLKQHFSDVI